VSNEPTASARTPRRAYFTFFSPRSLPFGSSWTSALSFPFSIDTTFDSGYFLRSASLTLAGRSVSEVIGSSDANLPSGCARDHQCHKTDLAPVGE
jgi:hypothetical protein